MYAMIHYLFDHILTIIFYLGAIMVQSLILDGLNASDLIKFLMTMVLTMAIWIPFIVDMIRYFMVRSHFKKAYSTLQHSEYIIDLIQRPRNLMGSDIYDLLKGCSENMRQRIAALQQKQSDLTKYIHLWVHQIKLPLSTLNLLSENTNDHMKYQISRIRLDLDMILYYCRMQSQPKDFLLKPIDLKQVIHDVLMQQRILLQQNGFTIESFDESVVVISDKKWLSFMLEQILANAIKYRDTHKSSFIHFDIRKSGKTIELSITDNGIGIHPNDLPYVFDPFFTGHNGYANANSSGMGLALIKSMAKLLHIDIKIESEYQQWTKVVLSFDDHGQTTNITNL